MLTKFLVLLENRFSVGWLTRQSPSSFLKAGLRVAMSGSRGGCGLGFKVCRLVLVFSVPAPLVFVVLVNTCPCPFR